MENNSTMTVTQTKPEFLTEALIEVLNNEWKVLSLENNRSVFTQLEMEIGRKYIKVWSYLVSGGERLNGNSCWMFVDKNTGECYKPASYKAPAKIVRYRLLEIASRELCFANADWAGSYLYIR